MTFFTFAATNGRIVVNHIIQTVNIFEAPCPSPLCMPLRPKAKQPAQVVQLFGIYARNLKPKTLAFAKENRKRETEEKASSDTCFQNVAPLKFNEGSRQSDGDFDLFVSQSEAFLLQSVENVENKESLPEKLKAVYFHVVASEQWNASRINLCDRNYLVSATNLVHYLALKVLDIEQLKEDLFSCGLINLESINSNVLASLTATIQLLENLKLDNQNIIETIEAETCKDEITGQKKDKRWTVHAMKRKAFLNKQLLLGPLGEGRKTCIMVTVGQEATESETLIPDLLKAGTSVIRLNCAHGDPSLWNDIIRRVKSSSKMLEMPCRILMDLAGPKLRTGHLKPGLSVTKISAKKDSTGNVVFPAQVWLSLKGVDPPPHLSLDSTLCIDKEKFLTQLEVGDTLRFHDARGRKRMLKISKKFPVFGSTGFLAECVRTAYVQSGTELRLTRKKGIFSAGKVVNVPATEQYLWLKVGDLLIITREDGSFHEPSEPYKNIPHRITCPSSYLFDSVKVGEPIAFDDGKIWGRIQGASNSEVIVSITHAGLKGTKLGAEKSINIPESNIRFEGLTSKDLIDLKFVASHADMVGVSFVRDVHDIVLLRQELKKRKLDNLGIVLKIETKSGFENLPLMLLEAMKSPNPLGVMIARGDLAVECGWENLADLQEEILAICDAAHVPVIWATQVLESLAKSGVPTRAEITDAANGRRASCVMLNKGKHIVEAVSTLDTILHSKALKIKADLKPVLLSNHRS